MPAIQLERLNQQIGELAWKFTQPIQFQQSLRELMYFYSNRTFHPGNFTQANNAFKAYHLPNILLSTLEEFFDPFCQENPTAALLLAETLWEDDHLEPRLFAASLLGMTPVKEGSQITQQLIKWCSPDEDRQVVIALLVRGSREIRKNHPDDWIRMVKTWLEHSDHAFQGIGLMALIPALNDREFENFPPLLDSLSGILIQAPLPLHRELLQVLLLLAVRSPSETTFLLKQALVLGENPGIIRIARKLLPDLDQTMQAQIRQVLNNLPTTPRSRFTQE